MSDGDPSGFELPTPRSSKIEDAVARGVRRASGEYPAQRSPVATWAKVVSALAAVLTIAGVVASAVFATKGEVAAGVAEAKSTALDSDSKLTVRVVTLEGSVAAHHEAQAKSEPAIERKIDTLASDVAQLNINLIILGERFGAARDMRKLPSQRSVKDTKP